MKITFFSDSAAYGDELLVKTSEGECPISSGDSLNVESVDSSGVTVSTRAYKRLSALAVLLLFLRRFVLNFLNIFILNYPGKWYEKIEPYALTPIDISLDKDLEIKSVGSEFDQKSMSIKPRRIFVNDKEILQGIIYDKNRMDTMFLTYVFDIVSILIYAYLVLGFVLVFSGRMTDPIVFVPFFIIAFSLLFAVIAKIVRACKEKRVFENNLMGKL